MAKFSVDKRKLEALIGNLGDFIVDETNELAKDIHKGVITDTPVRTGTARAGWEFVEAEKLGQPAQVGNNVEYVKYLEFGTRDMAPLGFIQRNVTQQLNRR